jgi:hypothetical protein
VRSPPPDAELPVFSSRAIVGTPPAVAYRADVLAQAVGCEEDGRLTGLGRRSGRATRPPGRKRGGGREETDDRQHREQRADPPSRILKQRTSFGSSCRRSGRPTARRAGGAALIPDRSALHHTVPPTRSAEHRVSRTNAWPDRLRPTRWSVRPSTAKLACSTLTSSRCAAPCAHCRPERLALTSGPPRRPRPGRPARSRRRQRQDHHPRGPRLLAAWPGAISTDRGHHVQPTAADELRERLDRVMARPGWRPVGARPTFHALGLRSCGRLGWFGGAGRSRGGHPGDRPAPERGRAASSRRGVLAPRLDVGVTAERSPHPHPGPVGRAFVAYQADSPIPAGSTWMIVVEVSGPAGGWSCRPVADACADLLVDESRRRSNPLDLAILLAAWLIRSSSSAMTTSRHGWRLPMSGGSRPDARRSVAPLTRH